MPVLRLLLVLLFGELDQVPMVCVTCTLLRDVLLGCICDIRDGRRDIAYGLRDEIQNHIPGRFVYGCGCRLGCFEPCVVSGWPRLISH